MGRLFFILAIFILGWLAFRYFRSQVILRDQQLKNNKAGQDSITQVKACAYCGIHIPEDEMIKKDKLQFCSYQHMIDFEKKNR